MKRLSALCAVSMTVQLCLTACDGRQSDPLTVEVGAFDCLRVSADADPFTVTDAMATNGGDHEKSGDYEWNESDVVPITLAVDSIAVDGIGATTTGSTVTVTEPGTYRVTGTLTDGQILVDSEGPGVVRLILGGMSISNSGDAALIVLSAEKTILVLADNTTNSVSDGTTYPEGSDQNAAIFSKDPLSIYGEGSLTVLARFNDGITSKDGLVIRSGSLTVTAIDDGIRGKDYLVVRGGTIQVTSGGDGLKSDNDKDGALGYILVEDGAIDIQAEGDALQAETDALVKGGTLGLVSGGGSEETISEDLSAKGIKGGASVVMDGGTLDIDAADDGLHSNGMLVINGGSIQIASGDDGIHADAELVINDGKIDVKKSYEGIENTGADMTINGGEIRVSASDDGINVAGAGDVGPGGPGTISSNYHLYLNAGYVVSDATGDGVDVNGSIVMNDGCMIVHGPTANNNSAIDYDGSFRMLGGFLLAAGSYGMAQGPGSTSTQGSLYLTFRSMTPAGTLVHVQTRSGQAVLDFIPGRNFQSIVFSSPSLQTGQTYQLYEGGSASGTASDGLYQGGTYTPGTKITSFTLSAMVMGVNAW